MDDAERPGPYVDWAMAMLKRWRAKGVEPALYAPLNEPEINNDFPPQWLHDVVVQLGQRLRAAGFKTKLVIPDDENPRDAYTRASRCSRPRARGTSAPSLPRLPVGQSDDGRLRRSPWPSCPSG